MKGHHEGKQAPVTMHFSFVVSSGLGYQIPSLFQNDSSFLEFQKALRSLKKHGFTGVELNLDSDEQRVLSKIRESINEEGLRLVAVGTGLIYVQKKLSFTDLDSAKRRKALEMVKTLLRFASNEHAVTVIGLVRGAPSGDIDAARKLLREGLVECDRTATEHGTRIALEAINRYETPLLNTAREVAALIDEERLAATGLLLDTFHMNIEEASIEETIRDYISKITHFHIADSNRWPPGYGHLRVEQQLRLLERLGYEGWVSVETIAKPDNMSAVVDTAHFLRTHNFIQA
jgi:sugar phosphate isomerase/epimerase